MAADDGAGRYDVEAPGCGDHWREFQANGLWNSGDFTGKTDRPPHAYRHRPERVRRTAEAGATAPAADLLARVREGTVCAPCEDNINSLEVAVAQVNDRTSRVYLSGVD